MNYTKLTTAQRIIISASHNVEFCRRDYERGKASKYELEELIRKLKKIHKDHPLAWK